MNDFFINRGIIDATLLLIGFLMVIIIVAGLIDLFLKRKAKQKAIAIATSKEPKVRRKEAEKSHKRIEALKKIEEEERIDERIITEKIFKDRRF
ncbi:MAG: hypothetical protein ACW981_09395 [Candidatus Hodarchaeales archaeon]|jgi:flagellar biosynthesis/type III secretory pathway M-ring protein FliF/YscJ